MTYYLFDDRNISWRKFDELNHFVYSILNIDTDNLIVDIIFKFDPHKQIFLHRHCAVNHTFVIHGEHQLFERNGKLKEVRSVGSYTCRLADSEPHRECGGDEGAVVLFSIRGTDDVMYEILDDEENVITSLGMQDFIYLHETNVIERRTGICA
jgi:hypothetical protein